jgi:sensor histidine kinase YesM
LVQRYLDIEQVRFGDRLTLRVSVDDNVWKARVPPMVLQPIVENAVRHAIAVRTSGGRIDVTARREGDRLHLTVEDDGAGLSATPNGATNGGGIGLANTRERLRHLYGDNQHLILDRGVLGGLRVRFDLPFHE